jgi:hypothetical protein
VQIHCLFCLCHIFFLFINDAREKATSSATKQLKIKNSPRELKLIQNDLDNCRLFNYYFIVKELSISNILVRWKFGKSWKQRVLVIAYNCAFVMLNLLEKQERIKLLRKILKRRTFKSRKKYLKIINVGIFQKQKKT